MEAVNLNSIPINSIIEFCSSQERSIIYSYSNTTCVNVSKYLLKNGTLIMFWHFKQFWNFNRKYSESSNITSEII
jgi:hypothetical protein